MSHAITNQPFALVRDHLRGTDEWHPTTCVDRLGLSKRLEVVLRCYDFWFVRDEALGWCGPFKGREQAYNFLQVMQPMFRAA